MKLALYIYNKYSYSSAPVNAQMFSVGVNFSSTMLSGMSFWEVEFKTDMTSHRGARLTEIPVSRRAIPSVRSRKVSALIYLPFWGLESTFSLVDLFFKQVLGGLLGNNNQTANPRRARTVDAIQQSSADLQSYDNRKKFKITLLGKKVIQRIHGGRDSNLWAPDRGRVGVWLWQLGRGVLVKTSEKKNKSVPDGSLG